MAQQGMMAAYLEKLEDLYLEFGDEETELAWRIDEWLFAEQRLNLIGDYDIMMANDLEVIVDITVNSGFSFTLVATRTANKIDWVREGF